MKRIAVALVAALVGLVAIIPAGAAFPIGENFDAALTLPGGWTSGFTGAGVGWLGTTTAADTAPNSFLGDEPSSISDKLLVSPAFTVLAAGQVTFRHRFNVENGFDGGVFEYSINAGAWTDIVVGGGSLTGQGYNGVLVGSNPLSGRQAFTNTTGGMFVTTTANLPPAANGQSVQVRWRLTTDGSVAAPAPNGWWVDTVYLAGVAGATPCAGAGTTQSCLNNLLTDINGITMPPATAQMQTTLRSYQAAAQRIQNIVVGPQKGDAICQIMTTLVVAVGPAVRTGGLTNANGLQIVDDANKVKASLTPVHPCLASPLPPGVNRIADLSITKTDGVVNVVPGTTTTYTITASNAGPDAATGATVVDTLPAAISGATWTCVGAGGGTCPAPNGAGNLNALVNLPSGGSVTFTVSAPISPSATGSLVNTATVTVPAVGVVDPVPANNSATDTDTLTPQGDLIITKTIAGLPASVNANQSFAYILTVANAGPSTATGAIINDAAPANFTATNWVCGNNQGGSTCSLGTASGSVTNLSVTLPPGSTLTVVFNGTAAASGTIDNIATITAPGGFTDTNPGNNTGLYSVAIQQIIG